MYFICILYIYTRARTYIYIYTHACAHLRARARKYVRTCEWMGIHIYCVYVRINKHPL